MPNFPFSCLDVECRVNWWVGGEQMLAQERVSSKGVCCAPHKVVLRRPGLDLRWEKMEAQDSRFERPALSHGGRRTSQRR